MAEHLPLVLGAIGAAALIIAIRTRRRRKPKRWRRKWGSSWGHPSK